MGATRYRLYMILGLVLGAAMLIAGVLALLLGGGPVLGWFMIVAGAVAVIAALLQLRRA